MTERIGRQTPTTSKILPYTKTYGKEAVNLYNLTTRKALEWQELMLYDILSYNDDGLWTHTKFGYSIPRRNGKNEVVAMRELFALINGEHVLHTAHRTPTSHAAWERLCDLIAETGLEEGIDYKTLKQMGLEEIRMMNGEGRINFRTRSSKSGLGEGFDLLVIDEAQEYTDDQAAALKYTVSSSMNPQTLLCGTPPTTVSVGTVFTKMRKNILSGESENAGWAEWSVEFQSDVHNKDLWYETNPSLGLRISERSVADEVGDDDIDFNIQRLGLWIQYNQKSAITQTDWEKAEIQTMPQLRGPMFAAVKFGIDGTNACLSVCVKTDDDKKMIECIDCQPIRNGINWIVDFILKTNPEKVVIDGQNGQAALVEMLKDNKYKRVTLPTSKEYVIANALFEQELFKDHIVHSGQPSLKAVATQCEHRAIGTNGGFGYRALRDGLEIGLLDSCVLAHWACSEHKERRVQKIYY